MQKVQESKLYLDIVGGDIAGGDDDDEKGDVDEGVDGGADGDVDGGDANHGGLVCDGVACWGKAPPPNKSVRREEPEVGGGGENSN